MDHAIQDADSPASACQTLTPVPKACDACRARKIRCNRESPCAHCLHARIQCTHSGAKPREKRTRILLTSQYEKKVDLIDRRLDHVVRLLEELKTQLPSSAPASTAAAASTSNASPTPASHTSNVSNVSNASHASHAGRAAATGTVVEGESSLTAHSVFANELLQKVVSRDSRPEMRERIDALGHVVEAMKKQPAAHEMTYPNAKPVQPRGLDGCELPPVERTLEVLKAAKAFKHTSIGWMFDMFHLNHFPEICLSAYMADDYDAARFITVSSGLHYLFWEYGKLFADKREEYLGFSRACAANLETALANLPLHLPASDDMIVALSFGAYYVVELAKPSLAWILLSKASELCQALGYHRIGTYRSEPLDGAQSKQSLFWIVYVLDKGLSLRLGRPSTIQDYDITVPSPPTDGPTFISSCFALWVMAASIQGQVYEHLYSPEAIAQPESVRVAHLQRLVHRLDELDAVTEASTAKWDKFSREASGDDMTDFFAISDHVLRLSCRTLVHRAVPNPAGSLTTFTDECIQAARETLARHQDCMAVVDRCEVGLFSIYMNWTILFAPFVPFIVLFCQVIETRDRADLARLQAFVSSLQIDSPVSEGVDRHRRLFQVLHSVASQYVESQASGTGREEQQANFEVDTCLAALGFPSQTIPEQHEPGHLQGAGNDASNPAFQRGVNPMIWMGNGAELEDWFYSNQQMMTFLEDGFPDEGRWGGG